jgi:hypothetical protein
MQIEDQADPNQRPVARLITNTTKPQGRLGFMQVALSINDQSEFLEILNAPRLWVPYELSYP